MINKTTAAVHFHAAAVVVLLSNSNDDRVGLSQDHAFGNDYHALVGNGELSAVSLQVIADFHSGWNLHVFINDGTANSTVPSDFDIIKQDTILNCGPGMNETARADDTALDPRSAHYGACGQQGVRSHASAVRLIQDCLSRWPRLVASMDRPLIVIEIEQRRNTDQIHVGFVI